MESREFSQISLCRRRSVRWKISLIKLSNSFLAREMDSKVMNGGRYGEQASDFGKPVFELVRYPWPNCIACKFIRVKASMSKSSVGSARSRSQYLFEIIIDSKSVDVWSSRGGTRQEVLDFRECFCQQRPILMIKPGPNTLDRCQNRGHSSKTFTS